jgi:hypothetical protein
MKPRISAKQARHIFFSWIKRTAITLFVGKTTIAIGSVIALMVTAFNLGQQRIYKTYSSDQRLGVEMEVRRSAVGRAKNLAKAFDLTAQGAVFWSLNIPDASHDNFQPVVVRVPRGSDLKDLPEQINEEYVIGFDRSGLDEIHAALHTQFQCDWWSIKEMPRSVMTLSFQDLGGRSIIVCPLYASADSVSPLGFTLLVLKAQKPSPEQMSWANKVQRQMVTRVIGGQL